MKRFVYVYKINLRSKLWNCSSSIYELKVINVKIIFFMPARSILRILKPLVSSEAMSNERYLTIAQVLFFYFYTKFSFRN